MFFINRFANSMFPHRLSGRFGEALNPSHPGFVIKVIVKLYVILDVGRRAAVAELRNVYKLKDEVKEGLTGFRGGFEESVTI